jgi:sortase A
VRRRIGFLLLGLGVATLGWVAVTITVGDPITSLYTRYEQHGLASRLAVAEIGWHTAPRLRALRAGRPTPVGQARLVTRTATTKRDAQRFARSLHDGDPIGRIVIPRLHLKMIVVQGTTESDLMRGPGHYDARSGQATGLPGMGRNVAIAGHRTTYLHPFRHIDDLRRGDRIYLVMPYGTFRYTVYRHRIVASNDWSALRRHRGETLVLSACHPLYSASHRWIVLARLTHAPRSASA